MEQTGSRVTGGLVRVAVVFASLATLCVSDGIGPRLVPFPSPAVRATTHAGGPRAPWAGRLPAAGADWHAVAGHDSKAVTPVWNNASHRRAALSPPGVKSARPPDFYTSPNYSFCSASPARGRAPPPAS